jgi:hypothetical protein
MILDGIGLNALRFKTANVSLAAPDFHEWRFEAYTSAPHRVAASGNFKPRGCSAPMLFVVGAAKQLLAPV